MDAEMDKITKIFAGENYDKPERICVNKLDLFEYEGEKNGTKIILLINEFKNNNMDCEIESVFIRGGGEDIITYLPCASFRAYRMETSEESEKRAKAIRKQAKEWRERMARKKRRIK